MCDPLLLATGPRRWQKHYGNQTHALNDISPWRFLTKIIGKQTPSPLVVREEEEIPACLREEPLSTPPSPARCTHIPARSLGRVRS